MFETRFKKEGILNADIGLEYRRKILEPGGSIVRILYRKVIYQLFTKVT
jgi:Zn-dependent oligopeptidase